MYLKKWVSYVASAVFLVTSGGQVLAGPTGGMVESGQATIEQSNANTTIVDQQSDRAVAGFDSFNLGTDDQFLVKQPGSHAILWVKDYQNAPSQIHGRIEADGQVWISNRNGILVGETGEIDTAGTLLTSSSMRNQDFMAGRYEFSLPGNPRSAVINEGLISARDAGLVGLVAPGVVNDGIIRARLGRVGLASGNRFTLNVRGDGLFSFAPDDEVLEQVIDHRTGLPLKHLVSNNGLIEAPGGLVALSAVNTRLLLDSVIDNSGRILAPTYETQVGRVHFSTALPSQQRAAQQAALVPQPRQKVTVSGTIDVSGRGENQTGGEILILGEVLGLTNAILDASGDAGGGLVLVGGGFMGGQASVSDVEHYGIDPNRHDVGSATELTADADTQIVADALRDGDGGTVVLWSSETTETGATVSARGGELRGDGGLVETSSAGSLRFSGQIDVASPHGLGGTWLLDPSRVAILSPDNPAFAALESRELDLGSSIVDPASIEATLNSGANVDIRTRSENPRSFVLRDAISGPTDRYEMYIYDPIRKTSGGDASLRLVSFGAMQFFAGVTSTSGALDLTFSVGVHDGHDRPGLRMSSSGIIGNRPPYTTSTTNYVFETNGGDVDLFGPRFIAGGIFDTDGGDLRAQTAGYYSVSEMSFSNVLESTWLSGVELSGTYHDFAINTGSGNVYLNSTAPMCSNCSSNHGIIRLSNKAIVSSGQVTIIAGPQGDFGGSLVSGVEGDGIPEVYTDLPVILGGDATLAAVQVAPFSDFNPASPPPVNSAPTVGTGSLTNQPTTQNQSFNLTTVGNVFADDGGVGNLSLTSTGLPSGISFTDNGDGTATFSGSPTVAGNFRVTLTATDAGGLSVDRTFVIVVAAAPTPPPTTDTPPTVSGLPTFTHTASVFGDVSLAVSRDYFADDNGTGNLTLSLRDGFSPPDGTSVSISPDGTLVVSGTIRRPGTYYVPVEATDASGQSVARTFTIVFDPGSSPAVEAVETETQTTTSLVVSTPTVPLRPTTGSNTSKPSPTEVAAIDPTADSQTVTENSDQPNIAVQSVVSAIHAGTTAIDGQRQEDANTSSGWVMPTRAADNLRQAWELAGDPNQSPATAAEGVLRLLVASLDITLGTGAEAAGRIGSEAFELITEDLANLLSNEPRGFDRLSPQEQQYALELRALLQKHQELLAEAYSAVQEERPILTLTGELALYLSGARTAQIALRRKVDVGSGPSTVDSAPSSNAPNKGLPSGYTRNADGTISGPGNLSGQQAVFRETGEVTADGSAILQRESGGYYSIDANGNQQYIPVADLPTNLQTRGETPWQQSQTHIQQQVGGGEKSYLNGVKVPHGTPGSVRPDAVPGCGTQCFEVKNYDLSTTSGQNGLVNTTVEQINTRATHLPDGMQQKVEIDITGQSVPRATQEAIADRIVQNSDGAVSLDDINFFERN